jgi:hypothetical protein
VNENIVTYCPVVKFVRSPNTQRSGKNPENIFSLLRVIALSHQNIIIFSMSSLNPLSLTPSRLPRFKPMAKLQNFFAIASGTEKTPGARRPQK